MRMAVARSIALRSSSIACHESEPSGFWRSGRITASGKSGSTVRQTSLVDANVTYPAPVRIAASVDNTAAPIYCCEPATLRSFP